MLVKLGGRAFGSNRQNPCKWMNSFMGSQINESGQAQLCHKSGCLWLLCSVSLCDVLCRVLLLCEGPHWEQAHAHGLPAEL